MKTHVEKVFVTEGVPEFTFVRPPNYNEILLDIRHPGKPVVIEGQSGTGKTTCVRKILQELGQDAGIPYLEARKAEDVRKIEEIAKKHPSGTYVIDDFHRLPIKLQRQLADLAKLAAEQAGGKALSKLILIGINQVGSGLIQLVPDIAKRCAIHRIQPGTKERIEDLIQAGCAKLNINIKDANVIFQESKGDYWLTQQLCQSVCTLNGVLEAQDAMRQLGFDLVQLRLKVVEKLHAAYYPAIKEFCRGRRFRPSNDPYFKLLKAVSQQDISIVDLTMLANALPEVRGSINNIKERRLSVLLSKKPLCARQFYYNPETKNFAIEDPALFYYLKHLNWDALRVDCGFKQAERDYEYDVALSFAGENRELARHIAEQLEELDVHVFFDEYFEANFLGKTWSEQLKRIFANDSKVVVCLLDKNHKDKIWPTFERDCFEPRVPEGAVIPIYLDDTVFPGIPKDLVGIKFLWNPADGNWKEKVVQDVVFKLIDRIA